MDEFPIIIKKKLQCHPNKYQDILIRNSPDESFRASSNWLVVQMPKTNQFKKQKRKEKERKQKSNQRRLSLLLSSLTLSQFLHLKGFSPATTNTKKIKEMFKTSLARHNSPVCNIWCFTMFACCENAFWQLGHLYGFKPVFFYLRRKEEEKKRKAIELNWVEQIVISDLTIVHQVMALQICQLRKRFVANGAERTRRRFVNSDNVD